MAINLSFVRTAEQVSFYESGALKRIFPLNGTLSGYWTQEDEAKLATPLTLVFNQIMG